MSTLVLSTDHELLKKFWDIENGIPAANREQFHNAFIAALSGHTHETTWTDALHIARGFVAQNLKAKNPMASGTEESPSVSTSS